MWGVGVYVPGTELTGAIAGLRLFCAMSVRVCIVTDSKYVCMGATGKALKWRSQGWVGSRGPLAGVVGGTTAANRVCGRPGPVALGPVARRAGGE